MKNETRRVILAEPVSMEPVRGVDGAPLYEARELPESSPKYQAMAPVLAQPPILFFLELDSLLSRYLEDDTPLVVVTDWTDPQELRGLRLESGEGWREDPGWCFLALYTNWEDMAASGIENIFAHELSHLWLMRLGFAIECSRSNRFHTCTAITDPYMAFSEGFAEHLEIVSRDMLGQESGGIYDHGYDLGAWLSARDAALRVHAVKNNRFLYHTALPGPEDQESYQHLHMAHITSSAFTPERLKNGLQAISSEGLVASFFYQLYRSEAMKAAPAPEVVYARFGAAGEKMSPLANLYVKILYTLSEMDLTGTSVFTGFVAQYAACFPEEREELLEKFFLVTNYVTADRHAGAVFGEMYRVGRRGIPEEVRTAYAAVKELKARWREALASGELSLDGAVYPSIFVQGDKEVCPVPWEPEEREKLRLDVNAATEIDFFSIDGLTLDQCGRLVQERERRGGFPSEEAFWKTVEEIRHIAC